MKLLTILGAVLVGAVVLLGIGGMAFHLFRDDGLIEKGVGALWEAQYQAPVLTIVLTLTAIYLGKIFYDSKFASKRDSKIPDLVLFAFVALGLFFVYRLIVTGNI